MTVVAEPDLPVMRLGDVAAAADGLPEAPLDVVPQTPSLPSATPVNPVACALAAMLSAASAGWMLGGVFTGSFARVVGVLGAVLAGAILIGAFRSRAAGILTALATPVVAVVGTILASADHATALDPVSLVRSAIDGGGLSQPPVPFDPGWRFLLTLIPGALAVTAATAAVSLNKPRLAALLPGPVVVVAVLLQPAGREVVSVVVSLVLLVGAVAVAFGADQARETRTSGRFEARRLLRAGGVLGGVVVAVVVLSQLGFLLPPSTVSTVIPPKKPATPPATVPDAVLFTVKSATPQPLRTGELDVYDGTSWLTPPYDTQRFVKVSDGTALPDFSSGRTTPASPKIATPPTSITATVTVGDVGDQRQLPDLAGTVSLAGAPNGLEYDPRTESVQTLERPVKGTTYTVTAATPPTTDELEKTPAADPSLADYLKVPAEPPGVQALLNSLPSGISTYQRLQLVRTQYFMKAVASGAGNPVDVPPARVDQILAGMPASPYEITAAEVLLARWSGVPARIGYGYYVETPTDSGTYEIHPSDGRLWLEAYFPGYGWTPILGQPAQATSSLDQQQKSKANILPSGQEVARIYVPLRATGLAQLYVEVQYYLVHAVLPVVILLILLIAGVPVLAKGLRVFRRGRWGDRHGPRAKVVVAYAAFRDRAIDLNLGHPTLTPLEMLDVTVLDEEHTELAWLVTRVLWGDLQRAVLESDVEAAEKLARGLTRRLSAGQPLALRGAALVGRASLREPWTDEIPNAWVRRRRVRLRVRLRRPTLTRPLVLRLSRAPGLGALLVAMGLLSGCGDVAGPRGGEAAAVGAGVRHLERCRHRARSGGRDGRLRTVEEPGTRGRHRDLLRTEGGGRGGDPADRDLQAGPRRHQRDPAAEGRHDARRHSLAGAPRGSADVFHDSR